MRGASSMLAVVASLLALPAVAAAQAISLAEQNVLVERHCVVCHTDKARNGGLSLQHFDAADAPPSLVAMMVSKLTKGVLLATVQAAPTDSQAAAQVVKGVDGGAMFAAGIKVPIATIAAFATSLAARAIEPTKWHSSRAPDAVTGGELTMVSTWRELPVVREQGVVPAYRLVMTCNESTREGEMQLAWSPVSKNGMLRVSFDAGSSIAHTVEGTETMGNGTGGTSGRAAFVLLQTKPGFRSARPLPSRTLSVSDLFPSETVEFSFDDMPADMRRSLSRCFDGSAAGL